MGRPAKVELCPPPVGYEAYPLAADVERWLALAEVSGVFGSRATVDAVRVDVRRWVTVLAEVLQVPGVPWVSLRYQDLSPARLRSAVDVFREVGYSDASVRRATGSLRGLLGFAESEGRPVVSGWRDALPMTDVGSVSDGVVVGAPVVTALRDAAKRSVWPERDECVVVALAVWGLSSGEVAGLYAEDVDVAGRRVDVVRAGRVRSVVLPDVGMGPWVRCLEDRDRRDVMTDRLFLREDGSALTVSALMVLLRRLCRSAGVDVRVTPAGLRGHAVRGWVRRAQAGEGAAGGWLQPDEVCRRVGVVSWEAAVRAAR